MNKKRKDVVGKSGFNPIVVRENNKKYIRILSLSCGKCRIWCQYGLQHYYNTRKSFFSHERYLNLKD